MAKHPTFAQAAYATAAALAAYDKAFADFSVANAALTDAKRALRQAQAAENAARVREEGNKLARDRRKAQTLAKQFGIRIERDPPAYGGGKEPLYWVLGPEDIYGGGDGVPRDDGTPVRADPCEGDHTAYGWSEVLGNVETYVADIQAWGSTLAHQLLNPKA